MSTVSRYEWNMYQKQRNNKEATCHICGICRYHKSIKRDTFICDNEASEYYSDYTDYNDGCEFYEERQRMIEDIQTHRPMEEDFTDYPGMSGQFDNMTGNMNL